MNNHKLVYHKLRQHCYPTHIDHDTHQPLRPERAGTAALHALSLAFTNAGLPTAEGAA